MAKQLSDSEKQANLKQLQVEVDAEMSLHYLRQLMPQIEKYLDDPSVAKLVIKLASMVPPNPEVLKRLKALEDKLDAFMDSFENTI